MKTDKIKPQAKVKLKNSYRIVTYLGKGGTSYVAQIKFWWFPFFWIEMWCGGVTYNVWNTPEEAKNFIKNGYKKPEQLDGKIVWTSDNKQLHDNEKS